MDKVPWLDSAGDAVHTFIRVPAGAVLAAAAFGILTPPLAGGSIALGSHATKAAARAFANTSPEPFSNIALSLIEDVVAVGISALMTLHPVLVLAIVGAFAILGIFIIRKIVRAMRVPFARIAAR